MTRTAVFAALVALGSLTASADPTPPSPAKKKPKDAGEAAYLEGRRHYDLREWDEAIASFKESYRLRADEKSLFNIAQAYRLKGDCVEALGFYQTYKRNFPDQIDGNAAADKVMAEMEPCLRAHASDPRPDKPVDTAPPTTPPPDPGTTDKPLPEHHPIIIERKQDGPEAAVGSADTDLPTPGHRLRVAGIGAAVVGIAAIGGGVLFGLEARDKSNQVGNGRGTFDPQLQSDGQSANRNAEILFGVGGALAVTGVVLYVLGRPSQPAEHLAIVPSRSGGTLSWRAAF